MHTVKIEPNRNKIIRILTFAFTLAPKLNSLVLPMPHRLPPVLPPLPDEPQSFFSSPYWRVPFLGLIVLLLLLASLFLVKVVLTYFTTVHEQSERFAPSEPVSVTINGEMLHIPANMIRFEEQRRPGPKAKVELYLHWPTLEGFTPEKADVFSEPAGKAPVIYISLAERDHALAPLERFKLIYPKLYDGVPFEGPAGLVGRHFRSGTGYDNEELFFEPQAAEPFVARCLRNDETGMPLTCLTEIRFGDKLEALVRFGRPYLSEWRDLQKAIHIQLARWQMK